MSKRDSIKQLESVADFWLGMAGAASLGFSKMCEERLRRKERGLEQRDLVEQVTLGLGVAFSRAQGVVEQAVAEITGGGIPDENSESDRRDRTDGFGGEELEDLRGRRVR
jgi:hypothetical protein